MKTLVSILLALAVSTVVAQGATEEEEKDKTLGEKTSETLDKAKEKTKEAGRAVVDTTKRAADAVVDAVTPEADARKVDVKLTEHDIDMPKKLEAGKTAFVVHNAGKEKHNFEVEGEGIDKKFLLPVGPEETKVLHVDLKSGSYKAYCPMENDAKKGMKVKLTVR
jgi:uncharacterized cupredoxin-like copper-binding protein